MLEDLDDIAVDNTVTLELGTVMNTAPEYYCYFVFLWLYLCHNIVVRIQYGDHQRIFPLRDKTKFTNIVRRQQLQRPRRPPQQRPHDDQFSSPWSGHFEIIQLFKLTKPIKIIPTSDKIQPLTRNESGQRI